MTILTTEALARQLLCISSNITTEISFVLVCLFKFSSRDVCLSNRIACFTGNLVVSKCCSISGNIWLNWLKKCSSVELIYQCSCFQGSLITLAQDCVAFKAFRSREDGHPFINIYLHCSCRDIVLQFSVMKGNFKVCFVWSDSNCWLPTNVIVVLS